jgi:hypothetical protein
MTVDYASYHKSDFDGVYGKFANRVSSFQLKDKTQVGSPSYYGNRIVTNYQIRTYSTKVIPSIPTLEGPVCYECSKNFIRESNILFNQVTKNLKGGWTGYISWIIFFGIIITISTIASLMEGEFDIVGFFSVFFPALFVGGCLCGKFLCYNTGYAINAQATMQKIQASYAQSMLNYLQLLNIWTGTKTDLTNLQMY